MTAVWSRYHFRSVWPLRAPPDRVYAVLSRLEEYPSWWPQVREVRVRGEGAGWARLRSFLPYELHLHAAVTRRDPVARVLQIGMSGDLRGWARWTVVTDGPGAAALFEQRVEVAGRLMRFLSLPGRPLFRFNHALMMRSGRRRLEQRLSSGLEVW